MDDGKFIKVPCKYTIYIIYAVYLRGEIIRMSPTLARKHGACTSRRPATGRGSRCGAHIRRNGGAPCFWATAPTGQALRAPNCTAPYSLHTLLFLPLRGTAPNGAEKTTGISLRAGLRSLRSLRVRAFRPHPATIGGAKRLPPATAWSITDAAPNTPDVSRSGATGCGPPFGYAGCPTRHR